MLPCSFGKFLLVLGCLVKVREKRGFLAPPPPPQLQLLCRPVKVELTAVSVHLILKKSVQNHVSGLEELRIQNNFEDYFVILRTSLGM